METIDSHIENSANASAKSETWKRGLIMLALAKVDRVFITLLSAPVQFGKWHAVVRNTVRI